MYCMCVTNCKKNEVVSKLKLVYETNHWFSRTSKTDIKLVDVANQCISLQLTFGIRLIFGFSYPASLNFIKLGNQQSPETINRLGVGAPSQIK